MRRPWRRWVARRTTSASTWKPSRSGGMRSSKARACGSHDRVPAAMIHTEDVIIAAEGARRFDGHLARPPAGAGPGLLIFSEMWGVAPKKREMADDYARLGWCAIAPNMFWRSEFTGVVPFEQADKAWQRLQAFDFDKSADDCRTAAEWLRASPHCNGKIAAIGFCMGGRIAFLAAARAGVNAA